MIKLLVLILFFNIFVAEKHFLKIYYTASSELKNTTKSAVVLDVDGNQVGSCDQTVLKTNYDWAGKVLKYFPKMYAFYTKECFHFLPSFFDYQLSSVRKKTNQSQGVHVFQRMDSCFLDDENPEVKPSMRYAYDGEDFLELNLDTWSWIALSPLAEQTKQILEADLANKHFSKTLLTYWCPLWLKGTLEYGKNMLHTLEFPSVSLLQKTPSSPIRCHATGFYPNSAQLYWTKDGEETHEDVEHGDILPNEDGSFQMTVDLNVSSVSTEDWERFDCVFHFSSAVDKVVLKLDKAVINTNNGKSHQTPTPVVAAVLVFGAVAIAAGVFVAYRIKRNRTHQGFFAIRFTSNETHEVRF